MSNSFLEKGIQIVTKAIQHDNAGEYEEAYKEYKKSLEYMINAIKFEKNPSTKETLTERFNGYYARAEQLKKVLNETPLQISKAFGML